MTALQIIEAFAAFKVDFVFAGSIAANLNGVLIDDPEVEVVVPQTLDQFKKVEKALLKLGFENTLPVGAEELFHFLDQYREQKNMKFWTFQSPQGKSHRVLIRLGASPDFFQPLEITMRGRSLRYLKIEDLKDLGLRLPPQTPQVTKVTPEFLLQRLENLRFYLHLEEKKELGKSKLISMKVPEPLLDAFKEKSQVLGVPYQTQIKILMKDWLK
jgi:predicted DNA binding CopG/RHH family protein